MNFSEFSKKSFANEGIKWSLKMLPSVKSVIENPWPKIFEPPKKPPLICKDPTIEYKSFGTFWVNLTPSPRTPLLQKNFRPIGQNLRDQRSTIGMANFMGQFARLKWLDTGRDQLHSEWDRRLGSCSVVTIGRPKNPKN